MRVCPESGTIITQNTARPHRCIVCGFMTPVERVGDRKYRVGHHSIPEPVPAELSELAFAIADDQGAVYVKRTNDNKDV